jgi:hypothetical protein
MISLLLARASARTVLCFAFFCYLFFPVLNITNSVLIFSENVYATTFIPSIMPVITRSQAKASIGSSSGLLKTSSSSISIGSSSGLLILDNSVTSIGSTDELLIPPSSVIGSTDGLL